MLIKAYNNTLLEFPDDLAALILADPVGGQDVPDYSIEEINAIIHGVLGALFEEELTLEQNIALVSTSYSQQNPVDDKNLEKAFSLVQHYNQNIQLAEIAQVSPDLAFPCGGNVYLPASPALTAADIVDPDRK